MSDISLSAILLFVLVQVATAAMHAVRRSGREKECSTEKSSSYDKLIGNTPLIRLDKLSSIVGCNIFVKVRRREYFKCS
jgi:hypothetical protein